MEQLILTVAAMVGAAAPVAVRADHPPPHHAAASAGLPLTASSTLE
jgi:hypothetical protein